MPARRASKRRWSSDGNHTCRPSDAAAPPHLAGFQNAEEVREPLPLRVLGRLPTWLAGTLVRPGPGTFDVAVADGNAKGGTFTFRHMFDAPSLARGFEIGSGRVSYSAAKLNRGTEAHIARTGALPELEGGTFAEPPGSGLMGRALSSMTGKLWKSSAKPGVGDAISRSQSNMVTTVQGKLVVTSGDLISLDPVTLQPLHRFTYKDISPAFKGELCCGTPIRDARTGETLNFTLQFISASSAAYRICVIPDAGQPYVLAEYGAGEDFNYMHSFAVTENYVIMLHWPAVIKPMKLLVGQRLLDALAWEPERGTRLLVFDRRRGGAGLVATYRAEACFAFHTANAFEDGGGNVAVDVMAYDDVGITKSFKVKHLRRGRRPFPRATVKRFLLEGVADRGSPTELRPATGRQLVDTRLSLEMPRIDARRAGLPYRFLYSLALPKGSPWFVGICKLDLARGRRVAAWTAPNAFPAEPVFVPRPGGIADDDGVLLSVVLDGAARHSFLLLLDASTFTELARALLPFALPFDFHGEFFGLP